MVFSFANTSASRSRLIFSEVYKSISIWIIAGAIGCAPASRLPDVTVAEKQASLEEKSGSSADEILLQHDFGVISPGAVVTHVFRVENKTDLTWNLRMIRRTCNCTAASVSGEIVEAGAAIDVTVEYRAPNAAADESRSVLLEFDPPAALPVRLNVSSSVRPAVHMSPGAVNFQEVSGGRAVYRTVKVFNYGDVPWDGIRVIGDPEWLAITAEKVRRDVDADSGLRSPLEEWLLTVKTTSKIPVSGVHRSNLVVAPTNADLSISGTLPTSLTVVAALEAMPKQAFLGTVRTGQAAEREFVLVLSEEVAQLPPEMIQMTADIPGCETKMNWITAEGRYRRVNLSFTPLGEEGSLKGVVQMVASGIELKPCVIVVTGNIAGTDGKSN